ncbi:MAG: accessory gene regulator B family protein [Thermoanaerobacteraceae bacterium]|nr:accessory gene regulator B family protein [Thermoanaerobacteraceae bacterium]
MSVKDYSIHSLATSIGSWVSRQAGETEKLAVLVYGTEVLLGGIIKLAALAISSFLLGIPHLVAVQVVSAGFIRTLSGGAHCTAYYRCLLSSLLIFLGMGYSLKLGLPHLTVLSNHYMLFCFLVSFYWIYRWAPVPPDNKPLRTDRDRLVRKAWTIIAVLIIMAALIMVGTAKWWVWAITFSILWQCFTLTPFGQKFFYRLDKMLVFFEGKEVTWS